MRENRSAYKILVGKPEGMRPLWRPSNKWKVTIKMDLKQIGWYFVVWIHLTEGRDQWKVLASKVMNARVP
jgi:hypothetical protein